MAAVLESGVWNPWGEVTENPMPTMVDWPNLGEESPAIVVCPTCGHHVTMFVDCSTGTSQHYVDDCPLCCSAIELDVKVEEYLISSVVALRPY
jgi:hypothetical protein